MVTVNQEGAKMGWIECDEDEGCKKERESSKKVLQKNKRKKINVTVFFSTMAKEKKKRPLGNWGQESQGYSFPSLDFLGSVVPFAFFLSALTLPSALAILLDESLSLVPSTRWRHAADTLSL